MREKTLHLLEFDKVRRMLAEHASFGGGRELALSLEPAWELDAVRERQALTRQARDFQDRRGGGQIDGAHDMRLEIEAAARGRSLLPEELLEIRNTVAAARRLKRPIVREDARWPQLAELADRLDPCPAVHDGISDALEDDGDVKDGASEDLGRIRSKIRVAHDRLMRQLESTLKGKASQYLQEPLITQRDGRYVLPVKADFRSKVPGVVHDTSDSGATVFVEPMSAVEHGNEYRQLVVEERKEIERILRALSGRVAEEAEALTSTVEYLARLDLTFAAARLGFRMEAITPELLAEDLPPQLRFDAARHPLLDPESVVPVDVHVGDGFRIMVITGPNTGGKTVTLKTIGLLVLMAQAGLQIPTADGAKMAVFDAVYADIGDEQSIEQSLSTFSGHMTNIIALLEDAGPGSLVLLDELGAGTDPAEGAALAGAILDTLRERDITTVASTHYTELKTYAYATEGVANASVEFDVETLQPTFELTIGLPGQSNALAIAERLGLPGPLVDRARAGLTVAEVEMEDLLAEIREARRSAREDRIAASERRQKAERWAAKLESAVREMDEQRAEILNDARRQAERELEAARKAIERLMERAERVSEADRAVQEALQADLDEVATIVQEREEAEPVTPPPERSELEEGSRVRVRSLDQEGELLSAEPGEMEVQLGPLRIRVDLDDLELVSAQPEAPQTSGRTRSTTIERGAPDASPVELDLRGQRVDEALHELERRIDRALLMGAPYLHVIHGHGTGALKAAVRDALRKHRAITEFRPGKKGEGGDGVTIAKFD